MVREREWAIGLAVIAAGLFVAAITDSRYATPLLVGAGLCLVGATVLGLRDVQSHPRLVIVEPDVQIRGVQKRPHPRGGRLVSTTTTEAHLSVASVYATTHIEPGDEWGRGAYVYVRNLPRVGHQDALNVHTTLHFFGVDGKQVYEIYGRWSTTPQHMDPEKTVQPEEKTIPANGGRHSVDVAWQYQGESECYAFNDENRFLAIDLRHRPLGAGPVRVEVIAQGSNCQAAATFTLSCANGNLSIREGG